MTEMVSAESGDEDHEELSLVELAARVQRAELPVPVQNPQKLPLDQLDPEVFERLVAEIVSRRDHRGVSFYGRRGQKQYGLDIVEREPDLRRTLYQVKRYSTLTESLLKTAVKEYAGAPRRPGHGLPPRRFDPHRFVVVTSAETESDTHLVDAIHALQKTYEDAEDLHIEVWGVEELGRRTRDAVSLVSAVLGEAWARAWCGMTSGSRDDAAPAPMGLVSAPLATLGLSDAERRAGALQDTTPAEAARLYRQLADALEQKNFPGHAAEVRARQAAMTRAAGRPAEAFDIHFRLALSAVERGVPRGELHGSTEALAREAGTVQQAKWTVIRAVADWYETGSMLAETVPALREIADKEDPDTGLLCCFVLEQALVDGLFDLPAVRSLVVESEKAPRHLLDELRTLSERADSQDVEIRARLACALADTALTVDSTVDQVQAAYGQTITRAGAGRFQHARGLIQSRAAYAFAVHGDPEHAEDLWRQSVLASSEDGFFGDARHALRAVRKVTHDRGSFVWGLDRVTRALPNRRHLLSGAVDPALTSHAALHREKLPDAFGDTRRYLWESRLQGALQEEVLAMELFGDVLQASGYAAEAVDAYLYAGAAKKAAETAGGLEDVLDVGIWLRSPVRARRAAAIQVIGAQAALIEDADMAATVTRLAAEAQGVWTTSAFRPHPERDALDALTALAYRFPAETVDSILSLVEPALQQATRYNDEVAAILVSTLNFTGHSRSELTSAISRMMELPNQHDLWNMLERLAVPCRAGVLPAVETHAAAGLPEALDVLQSWFPASERAQRRARASCASLLREPVGVPRAYSRLDSGAGETVGLLLDLLACPEEELVEVPAASLGPDPANPEDAVALALNEATNVSAAETHDNATGLEAVAALTGDEAAHTAATRPAELAAAIARRLIAMVEDHYDSASSRNSRALALARLVEHIPPELANEIAYRLITVHRRPRLSASDTWEIDSNVPLSRTRMNTGAAHLSDNVLRAAARAWACARVPAEPMNEEERLFASYALRASVALLRSDQVNTRVRGARCVSSLAKGSSELSAQAAGLTLHGCEHVRAIGVAHVPHTDPLLAVLAADPAARVRAAVAARAKDLPEPVRHTLARDSHAAVRRTLGAALG